MGKNSHGLKHRTRHKLRKHGATTLTQHLQSFSEGQRVIVRIDPGFQRGFPHPKYEGRAGKVVGMQGRSYLVQVSDGDSEKVLVSLPVHLKALN